MTEPLENYDVKPRFPDLKRPPVYLMDGYRQDTVRLDMIVRVIHKCYRHGMRHLFLGIPAGMAAELNRWMRAEDDEILREVFRELLEDEHFCLPINYRFFQKLKHEFPELVLHGLDADPGDAADTAPAPEQGRAEYLAEQFAAQFAALGEQERKPLVILVTGPYRGTDVPLEHLLQALPKAVDFPFQIWDIYEKATGLKYC